MEDKKGIELLKKVINLVVADIKLGKQIAKDGINGADIIHIPELIKSVQEILEIASASQDVIKEAKDIDASEAGVLLMAAWTAAQEVLKEEE